MTARFEVSPPPAPGALRIGPVALPTARRSAYYLGLGTLAAIELIEWPVALAVAAGTYIADQAGSGRRDIRHRAAGRAVAGRARGRASARVDEDDLAVEITAAVPSELGPLGLWRRVLQLEPAGGPRGAGGRRGAPRAGTGHRGAGRVGSVTNGHGRRT